MAPVLHVVPLPTSVLAADRFLYLPAAGIAVAAALALQDVGGRLRRGLVPVAAATALLYAGCSWSRCDVWRSELGFWLTTVEQAPARAVVPMIELGNVLYRANRFEDAARIARAITPAAGPLEGILGRRVAANLAASSSQAGRYDVARAIRLDLLRLDPASPKRHFDLGLIELHAQRLPQAVASFQRACDLAPEYPDGREGLALALVVSDMPVAARGAPSTLERAEWLTRIGARAEAEEAWVSALGAPRLSRDGLLEGASFLVRRGGAGAAAQAVARVREVAPEAAPAFEVSLAERQAAEDAILAAQPRLSAAIAAFDGS
jgi:tetratricopeptide (TPR) repeat protein